ncbi:MAG: FAD-binding oxidoreductase [Betaproteobacteria bacterium]|nr:FAD-binding oxidoreductase [Betaproteobacteria bacterium]
MNEPARTDDATAAAVAALVAALGDDVVLTGDAIPERCHTDWSGHAPARPAALLRPRSTAEVSRALAICHAHGQGVVPQGGRTGMAGGAVPRPEDVVLSLERLNRIEELDAAACTMTVQAGVLLEHVQQAAAEANLLFALDLGARGSCQIGGNIAANAGGLNVLRYGPARDQVLGLEVVLADGSVLSSLRKLIKDNAGYDLRQLFVGSEGTLGVVTRAVLKLHPRPRRVQTLLAALPGYDAAVQLLRRLQASYPVSAFELMWQDFMQTALEWQAGRRAPLAGSHPFYALVELDGDADADAVQATLAEAAEAGLVLDAVLAASLADARGLWALREITGEFPARLEPINFDLSLPVGAIGEFAERCRTALRRRWPQHRSLFFGHVGDSNLHLTVDGRSIPGVPHGAVDALVYELLRDVPGASVSAEHGIGVLKRGWLGHCRSADEIAAMRRIKQALDPRAILNPGKVLP